MIAILFYIHMKSPYSYVAAHRDLMLARAGKMQFDWRLFTLDIGSQTGVPGWRNRAQNIYRDVRRFAMRLWLTIRSPKEVYDATVAQTLSPRLRPLSFEPRRASRSPHRQRRPH